MIFLRDPRWSKGSAAPPILGRSRSRSRSRSRHSHPNPVGSVGRCFLGSHEVESIKDERLLHGKAWASRCFKVLQDAVRLYLPEIFQILVTRNLLLCGRDHWKDPHDSAWSNWIFWSQLLPCWPYEFTHQGERDGDDAERSVECKRCNRRALGCWGSTYGCRTPSPSLDILVHQRCAFMIPTIVDEKTWPNMWRQAMKLYKWAEASSGTHFCVFLDVNINTSYMCVRPDRWLSHLGCPGRECRRECRSAWRGQDGTGIYGLTAWASFWGNLLISPSNMGIIQEAWSWVSHDWYRYYPYEIVWYWLLYSI